MKPEDAASGIGRDSKAFKKLNPHLFPPNPLKKALDAILADGFAEPVKPATPVLASVVMAPITEEAKLNKAERRFLAHLRLRYPETHVGIKSLGFLLADGCRYYPDFIVAPDENGHVIAYDVKACWGKSQTPHIEDDAMVKMKTAARLFRWAVFRAVWQDKAGEWNTRTFNP